MTEENMAGFIDRMNESPDAVRAEWEAKWLREKGQEWVDENEQYFDAWWDAVLELHGYEV